MKRLHLTLILTLLAIPLLAEKVTPQRAAEVASIFFQRSDPSTRSAVPELTLVWDGEDAAQTRSSSSDPAIYVFNRKGGGFVIVSADDYVRPILGFSFENEFKAEGMPSNVKWYMDYLKSYCRNVTTPDLKVASAWNSFTATKVIYPEYVTNENTAIRTNQWWQTSPFYDKTPLEGTRHCFAGCLPVALAEILTFFASQKDEYKVTGDGSTVGGYSMGGYSPDAYTLNTVYKWDLFKDAYWPTDVYALSEEACESVAQLVLDCGALVKAAYGTTSGTAASELDVVKAFGDHMGYNKAARFERPEHYTRRQWLDMLKNEMDAGRPLLYCGQSDKGGHAFVADGYAYYDDDLVIHFNFGYHGDDNGYYYYPHPQAQSMDFYYGQSAIFDFYPSNTGEYRFEGLYLIDTKAVKENGTVIWNQGYDNYYWGGAWGIKTISTSYTGPVELSIVDRDDNYVAKALSVNLENFDYWQDATSFGTYFSRSPYFGYKGIVQYKDDKGKLVPVKGPVDGSIVLEAPLMPAAFIKTESSYKLGSYFKLQLMNNDYAYEGVSYTTTWAFTKPNGTTVSYATDQQEVYLGATGTWTVKAVVKAVSDGTVKETIVAKFNVAK